MPGVHKIELVGQEVVAHELGITSQAISNWYKREDEDIKLGKPDWGMPVPVLIEYKPGKKPLKAWRRHQLPVWVKWHAKHLTEQGAHIPRRKAA